MRFNTLILLIFFAAALAPARAADKFLGAFDAWDAAVTAVGKTKACYMTSLPKKAEGKYKKRGETSVIVTHWPGRKMYNVVSVVAGYAYGKNAEVQVAIGGKKFTLYGQGERAWADSAKDDRALARAMRGGATMIVRGVSSRGTKTKDTYSLKGVSAAFAAINKACGVK